MAESAETHKPVWWSISEDRLLELLRRVEGGEPADMVYMAEYATADIEQISGTPTFSCPDCGIDRTEHEGDLGRWRDLCPNCQSVADPVED